VDYLYPDEEEGRIPIIAINGTNGKTTISRLLAHMIKETGVTVGNTTTDGIFINGKLIASGDTTGPISARVILNDPGIEVAVLETARGGIMRRGLAFDWCDVGIITNIEADHIGQDGIESVEDILRVKSLIAERVKDKGTVVLNAESPHLIRLIEEKNLSSHGREVVLFTLNENNEDFRRHIAQGKRGYFLRGDGLYEAEHQRESFIVRASEIPLTVGGTARFHIANVLAAIPAALELGLTMEEIIDGVQSFHPEANSGRTNLYQTKKGYVLLDYGHNPEAIRSIGEMVASWNISGVSAVIGAPGDRSEDMIRMTGEASATVFRKIIIREDEDLRGRQAGETANLLFEGIKKINRQVNCQAVLDPYEALERGLAQMQDNELMVYFYEDLEATTRLLKKHGARQVHEFSRLVPLSNGGPHEEVSWH
jgi:cyanophycin synthetase